MRPLQLKRDLLVASIGSSPQRSAKLPVFLDAGTMSASWVLCHILLVACWSNLEA